MAVPNANPLTWGLRVSPEEMENLCEEYQKQWDFYQRLVKNPNIRNPDRNAPNGDRNHLMVTTWDKVLALTDELNKGGYDWDDNPKNLKSYLNS